jgi:dipeptidyl-peptidase-4
MKKHQPLNLIFLALFLLLGPFSIQAQSTAFTLEQSVNGGAKFQPAGLSQLSWIPGTEKFAYAKESNGSWSLLAGNAAKAGTETLITLADFNKACNDADLSDFPRFPQLTWTGTHTLRFVMGSANYGIDLQTKKVARLVGWKEEAANHDVSQLEGVAYTIDQNLYISMPGKENHAVSTEANRGIRYGESTHRQEFGITKGTFWSPDGKRLAFYRTDETMVADYPVVDWSNVPATATMIKYPMAGQKSHQVTLGVHDPEANKTIYLQTGGDPEHYLTNITWSPDGKEIWVVEINRGQDLIQLNRYDSFTGARISNVLEEKHPKYLEPKNPALFLPNVPGEFLWQSERDGYNHIYHYRLDGTLIGQLTSGPWMVTNLLGFDAEGKNIYFESTQASAVERHVHSLNLKTKALTLLTPGIGTHRGILHPSGKYLLDIWTSVDVPRSIRLQDAKGKTLQELLVAEDPLASYNLPKPILSQIKAADGKTDLWCRMFQPKDFDPTKKYPVLIYVYNGPSTQLVTNTYLGAHRNGCSGLQTKDISCGPWTEGALPTAALSLSKRPSATWAMWKLRTKWQAWIT